MSNLGPQFGTMYHGFKRRPVGDTLKPGDALGQRDFRVSDTSRVYATPHPSLAWEYAESKASVAMDELAYSGDNQVRKSRYDFLQDWSTDVEKPGLAGPHVAEVQLEGFIDEDPHVQIDGTRSTAFRADRATIGKVETVPPGAQTSMLPNPSHGGRYVSKRQLDEQSQEREWQADAEAQDVAQREFQHALDLDANHPKLFDDGMSLMDAIRRKRDTERPVWRSGLLSNLPDGGIG